MIKSTNKMLMRIYTDEAAMHGDESVTEVIIARARSTGIAGATVLQGKLGFASTSVVHSHHILGIGDNPPLVIEIIDSEEKIEAFLPELEDLRGIGLVTTGPVNIVKIEKQA